MARYMPPEQNGKHDPRKRRSQTDRPARYVSDAEYRSGRADYSRNGSRQPRGSRGRREYYKKKEEMRRRKAKKRAVIVLAALAVLASIAIITVFLMRGCSSGIAGGGEQATETATEAATLPAYTPVTKELPKLEDNGEDGYADGSLYIWNASGFDIFKGDEKTALAYSEAIAEFKRALGGGVTVYNMVVPNHTAFGLPDRVLGSLDSNPQRDNTTVIYSNYGEQVVPVDIYNALGENRNKYIFYNTDNRWTTLGAYQAYAAFAQTAKLDPLDISSLKKKTVKEYSGSYIKSTDNDDLKSNLDSIDYYTIPGKYSCSVIERRPNGTIDESSKSVGMYKTKLEEDEDALDVIAYGDNPLFVVDNEENSDGRKLLLVKDTFGSALVPFLSSNYDEVHVIDFRYYEGNIKDYCAKKGITDALFVNGIMSANSAAQINKMKGLL